MKKLSLLFICLLIGTSNLYANNKTIRGQKGSLIKINSRVLSIGSEGRVVGIDLNTRIVSIKVQLDNQKIKNEYIAAGNLLVLKEVATEYVDVNGIDIVKKGSLVLSSLYGESRVTNVYDNDLIRISPLYYSGDKISDKVVNASDMEALIPTKFGVKGWDKEYTIYEGDIVTYNGDARILRTYKHNLVKLKCLSTNKIETISSLGLSLNKYIDKIDVNYDLLSEENSKESIEDLF